MLSVLWQKIRVFHRRNRKFIKMWKIGNKSNTVQTYIDVKVIKP